MDRQLPEDVKQVCLWLVRGYERRRKKCQCGQGGDREWERLEAVEQALVTAGDGIMPEAARVQLRTAIMLNAESGRAYPYERLGLTFVGRSEFYRRRDRFLADIASRLNLV